MGGGEGGYISFTKQKTIWKRKRYYLVRRTKQSITVTEERILGGRGKIFFLLNTCEERDIIYRRENLWKYEILLSEESESMERKEKFMNVDFSRRILLINGDFSDLLSGGQFFLMGGGRRGKQNEKQTFPWLSGRLSDKNFFDPFVKPLS